VCISVFGKCFCTISATVLDGLLGGTYIVMDVTFGCKTVPDTGPVMLGNPRALLEEVHGITTSLRKAM
jgi:hypothetical protein